MSCRVELQELRGRAFQRGRQFADVLQADVSLAALDPADIAAIKFGAVRQLFLRQPDRMSKRSESLPQQRLYVALRHCYSLDSADHPSTDLTYHLSDPAWEAKDD